ncbi:MAG: RagB/SusD family nutrient uptake outer membrane protein [Chitinophagaceae bacterium]|nr:RagB/SusD family nutrient uptake outer membrane protein [Chitinophagaceae bacterium]
MKKFIIIAGIALALTACNKKIDEIRPLTRIDKEGMLSSVSGVKETTTGLYLLLQGSGFVSYDVPLENFGEGRGNNVKLREYNPASLQSDAWYFQNSTAERLGYSAGFYRSSYQIIVSANTTLEGITTLEKNFNSLTVADQNDLLYSKGENMFLRAFAYFNLVRLYGKPYYQNAESSKTIPLKRTSAINDIPPPATVKEIYDFIAEELKVAAQLMKAPVSKTNAFVTTGAAWALLSRVYLYMGGSVSAPVDDHNKRSVAYADSLIDLSNGKYALLQGTAYNNMFADDSDGALGRAIFKNNKEIIFAHDNSQAGTTIDGIYHYDITYGGGLFTPSADFLQLLTPGDMRSSFFKFNPISNANETTKWLVLSGRTATRAPQIYFRLGEAYLNRAEAYAKLKNYTKARLDLKAIHTRAGLPVADIDAIADQDLLAAVLKERRIELAFEGHCGYDYFRNGLPMKRIAADNNGTERIIQPDDPKVVLTIPNF